MKRLLLDPGHGGSAYGAVGFGLKEKDLNLTVALKVKEQLRDYDVEVWLTREKDEFLTANQRISMAQRLIPHLFISCHHNGFTDPKARGVEVFHGAFNPRDDKLAANIAARISAAGVPNRGAKTKLSDDGITDHYFVIREIWNASTDAILVEGAFVTNPEDAALLETDSFLTSEAQAITDSVIEHLGLGLKGGIDNRVAIMLNGKEIAVGRLVGNDTMVGDNYLRDFAKSLGYEIVNWTDYPRTAVLALKSKTSLQLARAHCENAMRLLEEVLDK